MASGEEVERISRLLVKSKVQGTKYLTVDAHLNMLIARTGLNKWSQLRYLKLCGTSRRIRMSDFAPFPRESFFSFRNNINSSKRILF